MIRDSGLLFWTTLHSSEAIYTYAMCDIYNFAVIDLVILSLKHLL